MNKLRILITNNTLDARAGTELYVYDLALALLARGHQPIAYSSKLGTVARELRAAGVPVIDQLDSLSFTPDVIHGHHHLDSMTAMLHFPRTPTVYFCHSWKSWEEMPVRFPGIRRYLAMNQATYNRLTCEHGVPEEQVRWMPNFVDLARFQPRPPLPARAKRALVFSNYATENGFLPVVRAACERAGLPLDVVGNGVGSPVARPWEMLGDYDLIFASGRSALESLAVGAAVIICNDFGLGPMVSAAEFDQLRRFNFGFMSTRQRPFTIEEVLAQMARYDASDAAEVSRLVRTTAGLETTVDRLLEIYSEIIAEHQQAVPSPEEELKAAAVYLRQISERVKSHDQLKHLHLSAQGELDWMRQSLTWRCRNRLTRIKLLMSAYRFLRRMGF